MGKVNNCRQTLCLVLVFGLDLLLASCASLSSHRQANYLPWSGLPEAEVSTYQLIQVLAGEESYSVESAIEFGPERFQMIVINGVGHRLLRIEYDGEGIRVEKALLLPDSFDPEFVMQALQLAYWPGNSPTTRMQDGWHVESSGRQRQAYYRGELVAQIEYDDPCPLGGSVRVHNRQNNFNLIIKSQVLGSLQNEQGDNEFCTL